MAGAVIIDIFFITVFIRRPRLVTPFSIHILNLTILELLFILLLQPLDLLHNLDDSVYSRNLANCAYMKYVQWSSSLVHLQYAVICLDRWLAILAPLWYRTKTPLFGVQATLCAVVYQQAWYLPLFIADTVHARPPGSYCR